CTVVVSQNGKEIGRLNDSLAIQGVTASRPRPGLKLGSGIVPPLLGQDKVVRPLPAPVEDLAVGGGGRYLILHLPRVHKLAVFDVSAAQVVHQIGLAEDNIKFAAGMDKLLVVMPNLGLVQR